MNKIAVVIKDQELPEVYIFAYKNTKEGRRGIIEYLYKFAKNPELSFTWHDACNLHSHIYPLTHQIADKLVEDIENTSNSFDFRNLPIPNPLPPFPPI
jgi:hypothetical protein